MPPRLRGAIDWLLVVLPVIAIAWQIVDRGGPVAGVALIMVAVVVWLLLPSRAVADTDACSVCTHARADHHGNCQACLRVVVRGGSEAPDVPCARFRRIPVEPRWRSLVARLRR